MHVFRSVCVELSRGLSDDPEAPSAYRYCPWRCIRFLSIQSCFIVNWHSQFHTLSFNICACSRGFPSLHTLVVGTWTVWTNYQLFNSWRLSPYFPGRPFDVNSHWSIERFELNRPSCSYRTQQLCIVLHIPSRRISLSECLCSVKTNLGINIRLQLSEYDWYGSSALLSVRDERLITAFSHRTNVDGITED